MKFFKIGRLDEEEMLLKSFSLFFFFLLWRPFCSAEQNHFSNFDRGSPKEHFYLFILKLSHWPEMSFEEIVDHGEHMHIAGHRVITIGHLGLGEL